MRHSPVKPSWAVAFILAIMLPALVLSLLAFRALEREEAYMEKQVEKSYLAEVRLQVTEIKNRLSSLQDELTQNASFSNDDNIDRMLTNWKNQDPLIEVPFYISQDKEILYPKVSENLSEEEISFLNWNRDFVKDKVAIPVYQNIALYYQEVVLSESQKLEEQQLLSSETSQEIVDDEKSAWDDNKTMDSAEKGIMSERDTLEKQDEQLEVPELETASELKKQKSSSLVSTESLEKQDRAINNLNEMAPLEESQVPDSLEPLAAENLTTDQIKPSYETKSIVQTNEQSLVSDELLNSSGYSADPLEDLSLDKDYEDSLLNAPVSKKREEQKALEQFEKYEEVRNLVYDQATEEGQERLQRNVAPLKGVDRLVTNTPESIFISEPLNFTEIVSKGDVGIIPRFIEEQLKLLFWKKDSLGNITGCLLNNDNLISLITESIEDPLDDERLMTILDDAGRPLIQPDDISQVDWRVPFLSREISEILPRWEVAVYLTNPASISQEAKSVTIMMAAMIAFLVVSIVLGGGLFLRAFYLEMDLASKKTSFVANVSHELKTPLTSIRMFAEMLKEKRQKDPEKQEKYLSLMVSETERLSRLVNNVLDFSKMNQGKRKYQISLVNLSTLCEDILSRQRLRLETAGFKIIFSAPEKSMLFELDSEALGQCLINLISNSEKYSADIKEIQLKLHQGSGRYIIDIMDRGIGIAKSQASKIFKAFYRVDDSLTTKINGSGLGLSISQKIIKDMGGELSYIPRKGGGSIFRISFPMMNRKE